MTALKNSEGGPVPAPSGNAPIAADISETPSDSTSSKFLDRWTLVIVSVLTLLGALPRLVNLGSPSFWNDEGASSLFALAALKSGLPILQNLPGAIRLVNFDPLYSEIEAGSFSLLGIGALSARIPAAVFGILGIPTAYLLGQRLKGPYVGIALAAMMAFSTEFIAWSRQARGYSLFTLLLMLTLLVIFYRPVQPTRIRRWLVAAAAAGCIVLCGFASPSLALLYAPGAVVGVAAYYLVHWRTRIAAFFGLGRDATGFSAREANPWTWFRRIGAVLIVGLIILACFFPPRLLSDGLARIFQSGLGYAPYRFVFISRYVAYLGSYYLPVTCLAALGAVLVTYEHQEIEVAVLAFFLGALLTLSTLLSYVVNAAAGAPIYERYLTPLLVLLFYLCARGLVWIGMFARRRVRVLHSLRLSRASATTLVAVGIVAALLVPAAVVPSGLNTYPLANFSPSGSLVPWVPFSPWPSDPSALYGTPQPNFAGAAAYVLAHRAPSDVVMAIWPEAPTFYLGKVQYWMYAHPPPGSAVAVPGGFEYYLTGSRLVDNVTQFEAVLSSSSGWFLLDTNAVGALGPNLSLAVALFLQPISAASDVSITLYHWNQSSDLQLLFDLEGHRPDLRQAYGGNVTALVDWAVVYGVTVDRDRAVLLPMESVLTRDASPVDRPLAVLLSIFNQRLDLQERFPGVFAGNFTGLWQWASGVASGQTPDSAYSTLAPYASIYATSGA